MVENKLESNKRNEIKQKKSDKDRNGVIGGCVFGIILCFIGYLLYINLFEYIVGKMVVYIVGFLAFICFAVAISCWLDYIESKKIEKLEEEARKEEEEFSEINLDKRDLRAEKMFRMNQKELMRYYDMNLAQTKFLCVLGIVMIVFGIIIVIVTICMYATMNVDNLLLVVGGLSGIVVDFIGAVFIKLYTENIKAAVKFHSKFAESNNLLLANSIAHKIEDDQLRENTLSEISKNIVVLKKMDGKDT